MIPKVIPHFKGRSAQSLNSKFEAAACIPCQMTACRNIEKLGCFLLNSW